jgi:hypothetical protein
VLHGAYDESRTLPARRSDFEQFVEDEMAAIQDWWGTATASHIRQCAVHEIVALV